MECILHYTILMKGMPSKRQQQQQHNFIVRKKTISNYTDQQVAKANLGGTEKQLGVRV